MLGLRNSLWGKANCSWSLCDQQLGRY